MYSATAELYDLIYSSFKDYAAEAAHIAELIRTQNPAAERVLDVACGTAEHARLLTRDHGFAVDGLDLDPAFVRIARGKLTSGTVEHGDMRDFELGEKYDVVLCLFSSIGYARTLPAIRDTLACFRRHLAPGGVIFVEPWLEPSVIEPGRVMVHTVHGEDVTVSRMSLTGVRDSTSVVHFEYLIGRRDRIEHASEVHELGLFSSDQMLTCFRDAGLSATYDPQGPGGRGLYTARSAIADGGSDTGLALA